MVYLWALCQSPEIDVLTLRDLARTGDVAPISGRLKKMRPEQLDEIGLRTGLDSGADPSVKETLQNYKSEIEQLNRDRVSAENDNDPALLDRIDKETEWIESQARRLGWRGEPRRPLDEIKSACDSVRKAINRAIDEIRVWNPELADHLKPIIKIGKVVSYKPEPPVDWQVA